jgi:hypothetical protein
MALTSTIARLATVPESQKESMFLLHCRYFCNVHRDAFFNDMNQKDWVIILREGREIVGFSTVQVLRCTVDDAERVFLFSGDTVVDRAHWQESTLAGSFGHLLLRAMAEYNTGSLYWFLISKGHRTYRFLPVYFNSFYPAYDRTTPPEYARLIHAVATLKFGEAYDASAGLVRLAGQKDRLTPEMCEVPEGRRKDPHVRFFLERNPAYCHGDELACIADVARENLNRCAWRAIKSTVVDWNE